MIFPLHTVTFPWFPIKFMRSNHKKQYSIMGSFSNLLPNGSIYSVAPSIQRCRCTLARSFTIGFSLYAECSLFRCYINDTTNIFSSTLLEFSSSGFFSFWSTQLKSSMELHRFLNWVKSHSGKHELNSQNKLLSLEGTTSQEVEYNDACAFWCSMHSLPCVNILVVFVNVSLRL